MTTFINLPHEVQTHISNFLRPHNWTRGHVDDLPTNPPLNKINPLSKARDVAHIKAVHPNLQTVPLWKNTEWKERIRKWRDEHLTTMTWKYKYGTLHDEMIKMGWEKKINNDYRRQNCYVETTLMEGMGANYGKIKEFKVIWFEVCLLDLIVGTRPLPHCFGNDGNNIRRANNGNFNITNFIPPPTLKTTIPKDKRREWLIESFMDCILVYYGKKIVEKNRGKIVEKNSAPNFMKEFKKIMDLPSDYELSQTQLFRMFLKELKVAKKTCYCPSFTCCANCPDNIDKLCEQKINLVR